MADAAQRQWRLSDVVKQQRSSARIEDSATDGDDPPRSSGLSSTLLPGAADEAQQHCNPSCNLDDLELGVAVEPALAPQQPSGSRSNSSSKLLRCAVALGLLLSAAALALTVVLALQQAETLDRLQDAVGGNAEAIETVGTTIETAETTTSEDSAALHHTIDLLEAELEQLRQDHNFTFQAHESDHEAMRTTFEEHDSAYETVRALVDANRDSINSNAAVIDAESTRAVEAEAGLLQAAVNSTAAAIEAERTRATDREAVLDTAISELEQTVDDEAARAQQWRLEADEWRRDETARATEAEAGLQEAVQDNAAAIETVETTSPEGSAALQDTIDIIETELEQLRQDHQTTFEEHESVHEALRASVDANRDDIDSNAAAIGAERSRAVDAEAGMLQDAVLNSTFAAVEVETLNRLQQAVDSNAASIETAEATTSEDSAALHHTIDALEAELEQLRQDNNFAFQEHESVHEAVRTWIDANRDNIASNAAAIQAESSRATEAEAGLQESVDGNAAAIQAESSRAAEVEAGLQESVDGNTAAIRVESSRAAEVEADLQQSVDGNTAAIRVESSRATEVEADLQESVDGNAAAVPLRSYTSVVIDASPVIGTVNNDDGVWFAFDAQSGSSYQLDTDALTVDDTIMDLVDIDQRTTIVENDDDTRNTGTLSSFIEWTCPASGTYYVNVKGYGSTTGTFRLSIERSTAGGDPCDGDPCDGGTVGNAAAIQAESSRATEAEAEPPPGFVGPFEGMGITEFNDLGSALVSSPSECASRCASLAGCNSFDWGARGEVRGQCWLSSADRDSAGDAYTSWPLYDYYEKQQ
jgi:hypothetical protein